MAAIRTLDTFNFKECELEAVDGKPHAQFLLAQRFFLNDKSVACLVEQDRMHLALAWLDTGIRTLTSCPETKESAALLPQMRELRKKVVNKGAIQLDGEKLLQAGKLAGASRDMSIRATSIHWFKVAAANGSEAACVNLCNHYLEVYDATQKEDYILEAIKWDTLSTIVSAKNGNLEQLVILARQKQSEGLYDEAAKFFRQAAKVSQEAMIRLGLLYANAFLSLEQAVIRKEAARCFFEVKSRLDAADLMPKDAALIPYYFDLQEKVDLLYKDLKKFLEGKRDQARKEIEELQKEIQVVPHLKEYFSAFLKRFQSFVAAYELLSTGMFQKIPTELDEQAQSIAAMIADCLPGAIGVVAKGVTSLYKLKLNHDYQQFYDRVYHFFQSVEIDSFFLIAKDRYMLYLATIMTMINRDMICRRKDEKLSFVSEVKSAASGSDLNTTVKLAAASDADALLKAIMKGEVLPDEHCFENFVNIMKKKHGAISVVPDLQAYIITSRLEVISPKKLTTSSMMTALGASPRAVAVQSQPVSPVAAVVPASLPSSPVANPAPVTDAERTVFTLSGPAG